MRLHVEVPLLIADRLDFLVAEREEMRRKTTVETGIDEQGRSRTELRRPPPLSRTAMLSHIIEMGFDQFMRTYPSANALLRMPVPKMGRPRLPR